MYTNLLIRGLDVPFDSKPIANEEPSRVCDPVERPSMLGIGFRSGMLLHWINSHDYPWLEEWLISSKTLLARKGDCDIAPEALVDELAPIWSVVVLTLSKHVGDEVPIKWTSECQPRRWIFATLRQASDKCIMD
ncbi:hypothetical protein F9C07_12886 [Aspergillus flavus]|uniref:Uncharacterized protein n=1 Tax=Aspergillus flavus (strain ATCC 200026 / FGSC A1120 / IAM 13836 / NRRL 3357 / JCM 12722 / SRRC 167) TaxID=332952 RepID=A0A7U2N0J9_ASPFN|nr:hypothetical protein F9C07_12886 [Aspergillus flavus]RAQ62850.1 hypothetical protein COH20_011428 [Aspergillus flavus]RAQ71122.1 hypothetical protein COH21_008811 [Aspergillus flavus]